MYKKKTRRYAKKNGKNAVKEYHCAADPPHIPAAYPANNGHIVGRWIGVRKEKSLKENLRNENEIPAKPKKRRMIDNPKTYRVDESETIVINSDSEVIG